MTSTSPALPACTTAIEWPTVLVAATIYAGFALLTWFHETLPWWGLAAFGGWLVAWHGSLQHEVLHGHPTPWQWVNRLLVLPSLWLFLPFEVYRRQHLRHHRDRYLTDPLEDPESYYVTADLWVRLGSLGRALLWVNNSLLGRLLLGPMIMVLRFLLSELRDWWRGRADAKAWMLHVVGVGLVLAWTMGVCGLPLWQYLLLFVYPGLSLTLLRSFLEHQARPDVGERTVIVESGPLFSLLFLNNNLHLLHHERPGLPWYLLPAVFRAEYQRLITINRGYRYSGYGEIARRYLLCAKEPPVHPGGLTVEPLDPPGEENRGWRPAAVPLDGGG